MFNIDHIRSQFPALKQKVHGNDLVYLDSAATTLKPLSVIERITKFYSYETANVHRGAHYLSDMATNEFEKSRDVIRQLIGANSIEEIIFTKGTTESINLVAQSYGENFLHEGDEIVLTELEHHADIVPWQILAQKKKCVLKFIKISANGEFDLDSVNEKINLRTKIVAFSGCSNILGTFAPVQIIIQKAKAVGAITLLDAAQYISQVKIDVQALDVDFLVFSSHKLFGPYGFGVLYGKKSLLEKMPPYQTGGSMISSVEEICSTYNHLPFKFEAGTPHIEGAIGTLSAIEFFNQLDLPLVIAHEQKLMQTLQAELKVMGGIRLIGEAAHKAAIVSFVVEGAHHSDVGQILDQQGIAVRVGHHCTQPLLKKLGLTGTVRASISIYNNQSDIEKLVDGVKKAKRMLL
ncbi:MAG: SufS family cysteine desulfurase [Bdellovibrionaceae bacterium]|nr:SufS family cysteine desulfurase [Bdellovibrio sp.]